MCENKEGAEGGGGREGGEDQPPHAVERRAEVLLAERVSLPQQHTLLQGHRHGRAVLGTLTAGQAHAVHRAAHLNTRHHRHRLSKEQRSDNSWSLMWLP